MTEQEERLARERAEIAARVARFRETQQKFERERQEYYATTLGKALACILRREAQAELKKIRIRPERSRRFEVFISSAATLREVKA